MKRILQSAAASTLLLCSASLVSSAQSRNAVTHRTDLSEPVNEGEFKAKLFSQGDLLAFNLKVSWLDLSSKTGAFRYQLFVRPDFRTETKPASALMKQVHDCDIFLRLYDKDKFLLKSLAVPFSYSVDEDSVVNGLTANTSTAMTADEYRRFLIGSWAIGWDCGEVDWFTTFTLENTTS